ncbi:S8 family peptidase [Gordonia alkanivorans]|uniref:S8 family peptidase n=1 Tax=Gordonia alkanivorans TaxID=84096 RepID=UPI001F4D6E1F|nr:S8 family peptidase [Gordonia alkanivorans]
MADPDQPLDHLYLHGYATGESFDRYAREGGGGGYSRRSVDRGSHGLARNQELSDAFGELDGERGVYPLTDDELASQGTVVVLEGEGAAYPLKLESLNQMTRHRKTPKQPRWLLLSVRPATENAPERATVWVADEHRTAFLKLFEDFHTGELTRTGQPPNQDLVANISRIRKAVLADLWTSDGEPPKRGQHWWELWLDTSGGDTEAIYAFVNSYQLRMLPRSIQLRDRFVVWVEASWSQLEPLPFTLVPLAEIRKPEFIETIEDLPPAEQDEYVEDLVSRLSTSDASAPAVCHLDTGVLRSHVLIEGSLAQEDLHTIVGASGTDTDPRGHGTSMAGLALYGDRLDAALQSGEPVQLRHRLESVRMKPGPSEAHIDPLDYGSATIQAVALPEIAAERRRVFALTLSTKPDNPGDPTLWSAAVDALAVGTESTRDGDRFRLISKPDPNIARLIVVAAGNVDSYMKEHTDNSDLAAIEDPAQAWNALTVGAFTNLTEGSQHPQYEGWAPLAEAGELSPHSRTSMLFRHGIAPIKPDICMEGGNVLTDGDQMFETKLPGLSLRSTGNTNDVALASANATSAATAQAARLAALAMDRYPDYWPESIRGLLTHAAEWTPAMVRRVKAGKAKTPRVEQLRRYGWGVPTEDSVLNSSRSAVTLVTQDQFVPFDGNDYKMRRFRLHTLPWPTEALEELGAAPVRLRITLSYFVEPSASRRGWRQRYAYASHMLRFDLQGGLETRQQFVARINRNAQAQEDGQAGAGTTSERWLLGERQRHLGSLHQDEWSGSGSELAQCNSVAVYPAGGWWKNNKRQDRVDIPVRYSLILSLRTPEQGVDLYTPIATQLHVPIETEITVG